MRRSGSTKTLVPEHSIAVQTSLSSFRFPVHYDMRSGTVVSLVALQPSWVQDSWYHSTLSQYNTDLPSSQYNPNNNNNNNNNKKKSHFLSLSVPARVEGNLGGSGREQSHSRCKLYVSCVRQPLDFGGLGKAKTVVVFPVRVGHRIRLDGVAAAGTNQPSREYWTGFQNTRRIRTGKGRSQSIRATAQHTQNQYGKGTSKDNGSAMRKGPRQRDKGPKRVH
eukprot:1372238-Rhodomonas_salina.2